MKYKAVCCNAILLGTFFVLLFAAALASPPSLRAQTTTAAPAASTVNKIPAGTILPVVLRTTFSFDKCKSGEILQGRIAQEVPLPNGSSIRRGSLVEGHIVEVIPAANGQLQQVSLRFDKVRMNGQWVPVQTNLRAIAGFMDILDTSVPIETPGEGDVGNWLPTEQIGGDTVYGAQGPVMSADDTSKVIGRSVNDGVLVQPSAKAGTRCRGAMQGNDRPQALWVFSGDACGTYGIRYLQIVHAGRTSPEGTMILASAKPKLKLKNGDGLLLRVD